MGLVDIDQLSLDDLPVTRFDCPAGDDFRIAVMSLEAAPLLTYPCVMRSVEEIKAEIAKLTPAEVRQVARWLEEYAASIWDKQIEDDAAAGKLDRFIEEALEEHRQGKTRPLP